MRFKRSTCPECKQRAVKVSEVILAQSNIEYYPSRKQFEYAGETDVDWNSQVMDTKQSVWRGRKQELATLWCPDSHSWLTEITEK